MFSRILLALSTISAMSEWMGPQDPSRGFWMRLHRLDDRRIHGFDGSLERWWFCVNWVTFSEEQWALRKEFVTLQRATSEPVEKP